jgi:hypothetical protein
VRRYVNAWRAAWNWRLELERNRAPGIVKAGNPMTDYRLRNHDLLYAERDTRVLTWRNVVVFGAIALTVATGVVSHLGDRFNTTAAGFAPASSAVAAQHATARQPAVHLATPASSPSGS